MLINYFSNVGIDTRELDATSTELSFVLGREGYKGWPGMFEIFLNSMRCTSSKISAFKRVL